MEITEDNRHEFAESVTSAILKQYTEKDLYEIVWDKTLSEILDYSVSDLEMALEEWCPDALPSRVG